MLRGGARTFGAFGRAAAQQSFGFRPNQRAAFAAFRKFHAHRDFQLEHYRTTNAPPLGQSGPSALVNFLSDLSASEAFLHAPGVAAEGDLGEPIRQERKAVGFYNIYADCLTSLCSITHTTSTTTRLDTDIVNNHLDTHTETGASSQLQQTC
uniref:Uncharacterized protein n=1 Tax=Chromera velia CCMP2878 TaxID=1169474 RepID=A0A0G4FEE0_9ALVE|mmetsp:Transcript_41010/g.80912  ORF Transcript_41010/g.80912 Transcript_41010/m.80912 type:complete len:152 (-) Transcript_41010:563-1018(-)|eukprot:Cvel_3221.t1-p1 / transcript=Cvel_3221.t1 / gene=Cvel_3221 / organism=Chromera_velia_CCMP2878 / gene_product=hypothetical protein / transcript_product=hypothetical protein / location=Cvel_scaffold126:15171-17329(+) / protein_length=151 / sequence_SO=supercontig / SO=protein_coding / is_pseudo=false